MAGSVEGPFAKLSRAERQLKLLKKKVDAVWPPAKRWPVRTEKHRGGLEYRFYLGELPSVEPDWLLWSGEIMFDLRSALDHLAYQLHVRHFRGRVPPSVEGKTQFPIYTDPNSYVQNAYRIASLSRRDRRSLGHLQPYITRNDNWRWGRYWLGKLNTMHNIDKHRKLHVVAATQGVAHMPRFPPDVGLETFPIWGAKESHSHVETWTFTKPPAEIQDHRGAILDVTLEPEGGEEWVRLVPFLDATANSVRRVLTRFTNRFPPL